MTLRSENELRAAFADIDSNGSGSIDDKEFRFMILNKLNIPLTEEEVQAVIYEMDADRNGEIDVEEFLAFMRLVEHVSIARRYWGWIRNWTCIFVGGSKEETLNGQKRE